MPSSARAVGPSDESRSSAPNSAPANLLIFILNLNDEICWEFERIRIPQRARGCLRARTPRAGGGLFRLVDSHARRTRRTRRFGLDSLPAARAKNCFSGAASGGYTTRPTDAAGPFPDAGNQSQIQTQR